jgi:hypothetical protein
MPTLEPLLRVINNKLVEGHDIECLKMEGFVSAGCGSGNDAPNILEEEYRKGEPKKGFIAGRINSDVCGSMKRLTGRCLILSANIRI